MMSHWTAQQAPARAAALPMAPVAHRADMPHTAGWCRG